MTTSGSSNYNNTRNEIIYSALRKCGVGAEGETPSDETVSNAAGDLNRMIKGWQADGVKLWAYSELVLFLDTSSQKYSLGSTGDHCVVKDDLVTTSLDASAALGASTVTVDDESGISVDDTIGIVQDDGTIHWTLVDMLSGPTVTLVNVTTAAASSGNAVYAYTSRAPRPLRIPHARVQVDSTSEVPLNMIGREDYFNLANKAATGVPVQAYYNPTLTNGTLYIWPVADTVDYYLNLTAYRSIEDFDSASDNPDLPQECLQACIWGLAEEVKLEFGVDAITSAEIKLKAAEWYAKISNFDVEEADLFVSCDLD